MHDTQFLPDVNTIYTDTFLIAAGLQSCGREEREDVQAGRSHRLLCSRHHR